MRPTSVAVVVAPAVGIQSFERLQYHEAILESYGVTSLSRLGQLPISGNVVPQPGLTVPAQDVLVGETPFQNVLRVAPDADGTKTPRPHEHRGTGRLVKATPYIRNGCRLR